MPNDNIPLVAVELEFAVLFTVLVVEDATTSLAFCIDSTGERQDTVPAFIDPAVV